MTDRFYKALGYDLMEVFSVAFCSPLTDNPNDSCYQSLYIKDLGAVHFQRWGRDSKSFYIKVHSENGRSCSGAGVLQLNLNFLKIENFQYTWKLGFPSNEITREIVEKSQPEGVCFVENDRWHMLCFDVSALVWKVLNAHSVKKKLSLTFPSGHPYNVSGVRHIEPYLCTGRNKFRRAMLYRYGSTCAICGHGPVEALEAAYVAPDAVSDYSHWDNGLLLRADIHRLFVDGAIRINPYTHRVELASVLKGTPYMELEGRVLEKGKAIGSFDAPYPHFDFLDEKYADASEEYSADFEDNED